MKSKRVLEFGGNSVIPDIRKLSDMRDVIYDIEWLKTAKDADLYYMYRDLALNSQDRAIIMENGLRYDITVIPPGNLGVECIKTAGHYHPLIDNTRYSYPEVYEVLEGMAHYLLQRRKNGIIMDVVMIEANEGDKVIVPPNYGHITINPSHEELKMANWVSRDFESIYEPYKECGGGAYFELRNRSIIPNEKCNHLLDIRYLKPTNISTVGFYKDKDMYGLIKDVKKLGYLNKPQDYDWLWELVLSDKNRTKPPDLVMQK
ncbi:MAG: glucose-6-phosphate isomerase [Euryarchaeota archaeon]|nr:glucose-6-phosphate isomerase [Euryarchaeota archaeon]